MGAYGGPDPIHIGVYQPKVAVAVPPVSGAAGDALITLIELDNAAGLAGAVIALSCDPALLVPLSAGTTEATSGFSLTYLADAGGMVRMVLSRETELEGGEGSVAKIAFAVSSIVSKDAACPLEVREIELRDGAGALIEIGSLTDGAFAVVERGLSEELIYVDQRYAGEENGSWSKPFNSIGEAMAAASAGDTIQVAGGIYREHIMMREGVFLRGSGPLASKIWVENDTPNMAAVTFQGVSMGGIKGSIFVEVAGLRVPLLSA